MGRPRKTMETLEDGAIYPLGELPSSEEESTEEGLTETSEIVKEKPLVSNYATELMIKAGYKVCLTCGAQYCNDINGNPVCPESRTNCPRTGVSKNESE